MSGVSATFMSDQGLLPLPGPPSPRVTCAVASAGSHGEPASLSPSDALVVAKLIGGPNPAFMFGGAVREVDAFKALAAVAPDEWKDVGTDDGRRSALSGGG